MSVPKLYLNREEAAEACGVSPSPISRWKNAGRLRAKKTAKRGGRELFTPEDLRRCVESLEDA